MGNKKTLEKIVAAPKDSKISNKTFLTIFTDLRDFSYRREEVLEYFPNTFKIELYSVKKIYTLKLSVRL